MKKILFLFGFILFCAGAWGQTPYDTVNVYDPQNFTEMTTVDPSNFQLIGRKNSLNRRMHIDTFRNYVTPSVVHTWLGDPLDSTDVLSSFWRQFVTDSLGRVWYVDSDGDAKMLKDTTITGVSDGDKGDITVSGSGGAWNIDAGVVGSTEIASTAVTPGSYTVANITVDADGRITAAANGGAADGNGVFDAANNGDTLEITSAYFTGLTLTHINTDTELLFDNSIFDVVVESQAVAAGDRATVHLDTLGRAVIGVQPGTPESYVGFDLAIGDSIGLLVQLDDAFPASGQILVAGADSLFRFANASAVADGNGLIDALPAGDVSIDADTSTLQINDAGGINMYTIAANIQIGINDVAISAQDDIQIDASDKFFLYSSATATPGAITIAANNTGNSIYLGSDTIHLANRDDFPRPKSKLSFSEIKEDSDQNDFILLESPDSLDGTWSYKLPDNPFPYAMLSLGADTSAMYWIHRDSLGGGTDTDNQTIDTFSRSGSTVYLSLEDDGQAAKQLDLSVFLQTLDTDRDTLSISGSGTILRTPGNGFLRDSITGAALTIDLKKYNNAYVEIRMESCTSTTLTINNPWSALTDATYPTFEGQAGVYTFHFLGVSGTDNITWPATFYDSAGTALGTDAITAAGIMYTCAYNPVAAKYYCK